jgi:hypothetical protein
MPEDTEPVLWKLQLRVKLRIDVIWRATSVYKFANPQQMLRKDRDYICFPLAKSMDTSMPRHSYMIDCTSSILGHRRPAQHWHSRPCNTRSTKLVGTRAKSMCSKQPTTPRTLSPRTCLPPTHPPHHRCPKMVSRADRKARYGPRWRCNLTIRTGSSEPRTLTHHFRREIANKFCRPIQPWRDEEWFITRLVGLQKATSSFLRLPAELRQSILVHTVSAEMREGHDGKKLEVWIKNLKEVTWLIEQDVKVYVEPYWRAQKAKKTQPLVFGFQVSDVGNSGGKY